MPNQSFLEPSESKETQLGNFGTLTVLTVNGTTPEVLCDEDTRIRKATLAVENADVFVRIDNDTNITASPELYNFAMDDGDTWSSFDLGRQRHTVCCRDGESAKIMIAIAHEEIVII